jgi:hypothetical protein
MVEYRQTLSDLEYKPYLDLKVKPFKSDINKQVDYMSIHACITTMRAWAKACQEQGTSNW